MREQDYYPKLVKLGHQFGWLVEHHRTVKTASGRHMTAIMGDKGWVDFVFCHPGKKITLFREIKGAKTPVEPDQKKWLAAMHASGLDVDVWRCRATGPSPSRNSHSVALPLSSRCSDLRSRT